MPYVTIHKTIEGINACMNLSRGPFDKLAEIKCHFMGILVTIWERGSFDQGIFPIRSDSIFTTQKMALLCNIMYYGLAIPYCWSVVTIEIKGLGILLWCNLVAGTHGG